jgi:hypothetical protein
MKVQGQSVNRNHLWKQTRGVLLCICLFGGLQPSPAQSDSGQQVIATWNCDANGAWRDIVGRQGDWPKKQIEKRLVSALKDKNSQVRKNAAIALGEIESARAVNPLVAALKDNDQLVRACAGTSLVKIGSPAVLPLIALLKDRDPFVPALAAVTLSVIPDPVGRQALMAALSEQNIKAILGAHTLFLKLGVPGSEAALIETLTVYPNREMAEEFQNSGNPKLQVAAAAWAHKYKEWLAPPHTWGALRWGSGNTLAPPSASATNRGEVR